MLTYTDAEIEALRMEALAEDEADPEAFQPGTFGCHEVLHLACCFGDLVGSQLTRHTAVAMNPAWHRLAFEAEIALFNLYQAIGAAHLESEAPEIGVDRG